MVGRPCASSYRSILVKTSAEKILPTALAPKDAIATITHAFPDRHKNSVPPLFPIIATKQALQFICWPLPTKLMSAVYGVDSSYYALRDIHEDLNLTHGQEFEFLTGFSEDPMSERPMRLWEDYMSWVLFNQIKPLGFISFL